jgi:serine/threonine-protein kinase RsbW
MESIKKQAVFSNLEEVLEFVRAKAKAYGMCKTTVPDVILAVEELLVNIISYAFPDRENGYMEVQCSEEDNSLIVCIIDEGEIFDVTIVAEPDVSTPIHERKIGGMGIFLVKNVVDSILYKRKGKKNILTIKKRIK